MKIKRFLKSVTAAAIALVLTFAPAGDIPVLRGFGITASAEISYSTSADGKTLYITGPGDMPDYSFTGREYYEDGRTTAPWKDETANVTKIVIGSNVTKIGQYAFFNFRQVTSITITGSTLISKYAFRSCKALKTVNIYKGAKLYGSYVFSNGDKIETINIIDGNSDTDYNNIVNGHDTTYIGSNFDTAARKYVREISFNPGDGTGEMESVYAEYNKAYTPPPAHFQRPQTRISITGR